MQNQGESQIKVEKAFSSTLRPRGVKIPLQEKIFFSPLIQGFSYWKLFCLVLSK
jgi:hypothetical protein